MLYLASKATPPHEIHTTDNPLNDLEDKRLFVNYNPNATTSIASEQHLQEKVLLSKFAIPTPPQPAEDLDTNPNDHRTLWMGDLDPWLEEKGLEELWWNILKKRVIVKIIKPKSRRFDQFQGLSNSGYCFVEFESHEDAQDALSLNGSLLPDLAMPSQQQFPNNPDNQKKYFRINWANAVTLDAPVVQSPEFPVFVGDLSASTTEAHLLAFFQRRFPTSIKAVRVMTDSVSGKSKCYGFVRFTVELERARALVEMPGALLGGRHIRVKLANPKNRNRNFEAGLPGEFARGDWATSQIPPLQELPSESHEFSNYPELVQRNNVGISYSWNDEKINTSVFVGALSSKATEATLYSLFSGFGLIQQVRVLPGLNCGFIKYTTKEQAAMAITNLQGYNILGNCVRLSWGKPAHNRLQNLYQNHKLFPQKDTPKGKLMQQFDQFNQQHHNENSRGNCTMQELGQQLSQSARMYQATSQGQPNGEYYREPFYDISNSLHSYTPYSIPRYHSQGSQDDDLANAFGNLKVQEDIPVKGGNGYIQPPMNFPLNGQFNGYQADLKYFLNTLISHQVNEKNI